MEPQKVTITFKDDEGVFFEVPSTSEDGVTYTVHVFFDGMMWWCTCPGFWYRHKCKHVELCKGVLDHE